MRAGGIGAERKGSDRMPGISKKRSKKAGLPPGTVVHTGERRTDTVRVHIVTYDPGHMEESVSEGMSAEVAERLAGLTREPGGGGVRWIRVEGVHDPDTVTGIGSIFGIHHLILEDIANTVQRPKIEEYDGRLFVVLRALSSGGGGGRVAEEQISLILMPGTLLTFQEGPLPAWDVVLEQLRKSKGRVRSMGADFLLYSLVDAVVDGYFAVLEKTEEALERIEIEAASSPGERTLKDIQSLRRDMLILRRSVWPLREAVVRLERGTPLIGDAVRLYLRDVYDHLVQAVEILEAHRDLLSGALEIYLTGVSNRMNAVMKVLTVIATVFIPLTFLASVYGMNFERLWGKDWEYGFPAMLAVMAAIAALMIFLFRRKRWM
ncbi:MAG: magnesium/cobalt transporter CorA [Planctomycetota bacterium]|nr:magnesium/cobalt transporter CorA [Planctomycetota bacterium]